MFDDLPPLLEPAAPGGDMFAAFPGHQRPQQPMNSSPWSAVYDPPPAWAHQSPPSAPPWLSPGGFPTHSYSNAWAGSTPFHRPTELSPWSQPVGLPPWSTNDATAPANSAFSQPITSGFFGANKANNGPWSGVIRTTSVRGAPHPTVDPWSTPSHQPWDIMRPKSAGPDWGGGRTTPHTGVPAHLMPDVYDEKNLARRPRDWRPNYNPRATFLSSLPSLPSILKAPSDVHEYSDPIKRRVNQLFQYHPSRPPISHDLRLDPIHPSTLILHASSAHTRHPFNQIDLAQLATSPPAMTLRLFHPRLPWYIDVQQTQTNGITVIDILTQLYAALHTQIMQRHYWNEVLTTDDRGEIANAFHKRVRLMGGAKDVVDRGVLWVDFLGEDLIFEGLIRIKGGLWEIKTRKGS